MRLIASTKNYLGRSFFIVQLANIDRLQGAKMGRDNLYYDLLDAIKRGECPICSVALRTVASWMDSISYESVNDPQVRDNLRASHGFCNKHAHFAEEKAKRRDGNRKPMRTAKKAGDGAAELVHLHRMGRGEVDGARQLVMFDDIGNCTSDVLKMNP